MIELSIVVPTYNERPNVRELVRRLDASLRHCRWEVVFVDDDSPDGTADEIRALAQADSRVRCVQRLGRRGLARAVIEGVLSTSAPVFAVIDADLQHDEAQLPAMHARLLGLGHESPADIVVASRYAAGGSVGAWDEERAWMSRLATAIAHRVVPTGLTDPMSGFFVMRRATFDLAVRRLSGEGYKLLLDLLSSVPRPIRLAEIPYSFRPRVAGESKLDSAVLWEFTLLLMDKRFGRWVPPRFVLFSLVGLSGVAVHFAVLGLSYRVAHGSFALSQGAATLVAMTSNYALNNSLTYRDQRHNGLGWWRGLFTFYLVCGLGVVGNIGVASVMLERQSWALAAVAGILVGTVWNYAATRVVTWKAR